MSKEALCSICNKPKARDNRSNRCRSCAASAKKDTTGVDCIVVRHSAGNKKGSQKVYKYKATCKTCGKDRGYVFKSALNNNCPSCARKLSTKKTINNNDNGLKMFVDTPLQGQLQVRSSYEFFYCNYLNSKSIKYLYEPTKFKLSDNTTYTPDFYLLEEDKYIELKGKETPEFSRKFELFKKEYSQVSLEMLKHADLKKLGYNAGLFKNRFNVTILGSRWTVFLLTPKEYKKQFGDDSEAVTIPKSRGLYFRLDFLTHDVVLHEMYHAYYAQQTIHTTEELTHNDIEEINAELMSKAFFNWLYNYVNILENLKLIASRRYQLEIPIQFFDEEDMRHNQKVTEFLRTQMKNSYKNENVIDLMVKSSNISKESIE